MEVRKYCTVIVMNIFLKTKQFLILVTAAAFLTVGCGSIPDLPDAMNPMSWFTDDEKPVAANQTDSVKAYPDLKSVPERPKRRSLANQQSRIKQGLTADIKNARYTDASVRKEVQKRVAGPAAPSQVTLAQPAHMPTPLSVVSPVKAGVVAMPTKRIPAPVIRRPVMAAVSPSTIVPEASLVFLSRIRCPRPPKAFLKSERFISRMGRRSFSVATLPSFNNLQARNASRAGCWKLSDMRVVG